MILYPAIIIFSIIIIATLTAIFGSSIYGYTPTYAIIAVILGTVIEIAIDAVIAIIIVLLPKRFFNPFSKIFSVDKKERNFYEKIAIRKWKDLVFAEFGFDKKSVKNPTNNEYIFKFLQETCIAETMHFISIFLGFLLVLVFPLEYALSFPLPIAFVNLVLQIPPVMIQRYNRPKLILLYKRNANKTN